MQNASRSLGSVDNKVQEADRLKNITANLQAQLRQNMSALEEKLRRAREYVAKVKRLLSCECLEGRLFQEQTFMNELLFCILTRTVYIIHLEYRGLVQPIKCWTNPPAFRLPGPIFAALYIQLQKYFLTSDNVIFRLVNHN